MKSFKQFHNLSDLEVINPIAFNPLLESYIRKHRYKKSKKNQKTDVSVNVEPDTSINQSSTSSIDLQKSHVFSEPAR
jgi:hypothetical protein